MRESGEKFLADWSRLLRVLLHLSAVILPPLSRVSVPQNHGQNPSELYAELLCHRTLAVTDKYVFCIRRLVCCELCVRQKDGIERRGGFVRLTPKSYIEPIESPKLRTVVSLPRSNRTRSQRVDERRFQHQLSVFAINGSETQQSALCLRTAYAKPQATPCVW
jgi:hypothetical protein